MEKIRRRRDSQRRSAASESSVGLFITEKPDIEVRALGESLVLVNSHLISEAEWRSSRAKEMFFYMLSCGSGQSKEQITAALWPDVSPAKGTGNFHINLYRARRAVSPGGFIIEQGQYKLNPDLNIWFDVTEFEGLLSETERLPLGSEARATHLERAIDIYKGPFMQEFYGEWSNMRRRELEDKYLKAISMLSNFYSGKGDYYRAITVLEKSLVIDPYQDEVYCQIIEWHLAVCDKVSALRTYKRYLDTMVGEIESMPSARMEGLHKRILADKATT